MSACKVLNKEKVVVRSTREFKWIYLVLWEQYKLAVIASVDRLSTSSYNTTNIAVYLSIIKTIILVKHPRSQYLNNENAFIKISLCQVLLLFILCNIWMSCSRGVTYGSFSQSSRSAVSQQERSNESLITNSSEYWMT